MVLILKNHDTMPPSHPPEGAGHMGEAINQGNFSLSAKRQMGREDDANILTRRLPVIWQNEKKNQVSHFPVR